MIAFQLHAQPQKNVHNKQVTTGYTQKHLYANIPYQFNPIINTPNIFVFNLIHVQMLT